jgi:hypothetical protein
MVNYIIAYIALNYSLFSKRSCEKSSYKHFGQRSTHSTHDAYIMNGKGKPATENTTHLDDLEKPKFSLLVMSCGLKDRYGLTCHSFLTSRIVTIRVAQSRTFHVHSGLLIAESKRYAKSLNGDFKEAGDCAIEIEDEDPELFGFFLEYIYRDRSIPSRDVQHYSEYVTLARLYAMGERLMASAFQAYCLWRFTQSLEIRSPISEDALCELLQLACIEITERVREDPLRSQIFWLGGSKIKNLQKFGTFHQLLHDLPDLGRHLCLWVHRDQPPKASKPCELLYQRFGPESEHAFAKVAATTLDANERHSESSPDSP